MSSFWKPHPKFNHASPLTVSAKQLAWLHQAQSLERLQLQSIVSGLHASMLGFGVHCFLEPCVNPYSWRHIEIVKHNKHGSTIDWCWAYMIYLRDWIPWACFLRLRLSMSRAPWGIPCLPLIPRLLNRWGSLQPMLALMRLAKGFRHLLRLYHHLLRMVMMLSLGLSFTR